MSDVSNDVIKKKNIFHNWMGDPSCDIISISKFEIKI